MLEIKETSRTTLTNVIINAAQGDYKYITECKIIDGKISTLAIQISKKTIAEVETPSGKQNSETYSNIGFMSLQEGRKNIGVIDSEDVVPHVPVLDTIITKVM